MSIEGTNIKDISIGMMVSVNPKNDKSRELLVDGVVKDILTKSDHHPYGILVKLDDGTIGRVKKIFSNKTSNDSNYSASDNEPDLSEIVYGDENHYVEFKSSILWSKYITKDQIDKSNSEELRLYGKNASKFIIAKSLCGFLNSDGGFLILGVKEIKSSDENQITGINSEYNKLQDKTQDGYRRMILDEVIKPFLPSTVFNHFNDYFRFYFQSIEDKTVLGIKVIPSDFRVFVSISNTDLFFVRVDASTRKLSGPDMVDYCARRFN
ncbi:MAG: YwbE family protein [Pseudomonadota bacterium]|nr:YwbE family protein [Pseudomonadota bacterium]